MKVLQNISVDISAMTPGELTGGGRHLTVDYAFAPNPLGEILLASTRKGICCLFFVDDRAAALAEMKKMFPAANYTERMTGMMSDAMAVLGEPGETKESGETRESGEKTVPDKKTARVPLHLKGTPFQLEVWRALTEIPRGETRRYSEIAARVGRPKACRAAGSAIGANPVSILVPCHRVVPLSGAGRSTGGVGNYRWGAHRKKALLSNELEGTI